MLYRKMQIINMFADRSKKQFPKLFSEAHLQRFNRHPSQQAAAGPFETNKKLQSKSPSNQKLSSLSPCHKKLKPAGTRLFEGAHLPASGTISGQTFLQSQPSRATERHTRFMGRALSSEDMHAARSQKHRTLDIRNQFAIKITADPDISLSMIIGQFQEGEGNGLAEVLESSGETLRIDSKTGSSMAEFMEI